MAARLAPCLLVLLLVVSAGAEPRPLLEADEVRVKVRAKPVAGPAFLHHGEARVLAMGPQEIAGLAFTLTEGRKYPVLTWSVDGKQRREMLSKAKGHRLLLASKPKRTLLAFRDVLGRWHHLPGEGLRFTVRGIEMEVLDADHDGRWFETDEDLIRRVGDTHAVPLRSPHVLETFTLTVRGFDADASRLDLTLAPIDAELNEEERVVLRTLNRERERMGFLGTASLPEFARPLRLHADWMALHGKVQHHEEPDTEGYTLEGDAAGRASVILTHPRRTDIATYVDIDSAIHGHVLTMPEFVRTGVGAARAEKEGSVYGGIWTMEVGGFKHARVEAVRFPQVWPPHMATGVPCSWTTEGEDPRPPEDRGQEQGYPIRVYLTPGVAETAAVADLEVSLAVLGKEDEPLDCFVIAPGRPLGYEPSPFLRQLLGTLDPIFVLPRPILRANTWYVLQLEGILDGQPFLHRTAFRTGTLRGQYRDL